MQQPDYRYNAPAKDEQDAPMIGLRLFALAFWRARVLSLTVIGLCVLAALFYILFLRHPKYEATATIGPVPSAASAAPQGAGSILAGLAGATGSDPGSMMLSKYTQVLTSTRLAAWLERDHGVMKTLVPGWNVAANRWEPPSGAMAWTAGTFKSLFGMPGWSPPTPALLAQILSRMVSVDPVAGGDPISLHGQFYTITVTSSNPDYAAQLLGWILTDADAIVRRDQLMRTRDRIAYLTNAMKSTNEVSLRDYLNQLMVGQEQSLMTLKADREFAFDLVDAPSVAPSPIGFSISVLIALAILFGLLIDAAIMFVLLQDRVEEYHATGKNPLADPFPDPFEIARQAFASLRGGSKAL